LQFPQVNNGCQTPKFSSSEKKDLPNHNANTSGKKLLFLMSANFRINKDFVESKNTCQSEVFTSFASIFSQSRVKENFTRLNEEIKLRFASQK